MSKTSHGQRFFIRLFFTAAILFLSLQIISGYRDTMGYRYARLTGNEAGDWTYGSQVVTFFLQEYALMPYLRVLVNSEVKGVFNNRYVTVAVHEGDSIELDGTFYNRPVSVEVLDVSERVVNPRKGAVLRLHGNMLSLGKVKINGR
ncbi:MAG: hypothetical protein ACOY40_07650 [Bacillota bacterium]